MFYFVRLYETFGEDVHLATKLGEAYIKGHHGKDLKNRKKAATCLKHYIGYSFPFNGLDRTTAWLPENLLREVFLPPFEACIKAGAPTVMINSGDVNGLPGHANYRYLTEILKDELNFTGFSVSDWEDVKRLHTRDRLAETPEEAVRLAVMSGVDMSMVPYDFSFANYCVNIWRKDDMAFQARVDDAVLRILKFKDDVGLFENSYPFEDDLKEIGRVESEELSLAAAKESLVLAQNDGILPLKGTDKKILVTGPTANLVKVLNGGWSYTWLGDQEDLYAKFGRKKYTVLEALKNRSDHVVFSEGANFETLVNLNETIDAAKSSDIIVLCLGEATYTETPGNVNNMMIDKAQIELSSALLDTGKPVVVVYLGGRPRIITEIAERANAVVIAFLPGSEGAIAIADLIYGDFNPSGKMSISYPSGPNSITTYDKKALEDYSYTVGMNVKNGFSPLYEFGHGLSYTTFEYSNLTLRSDLIGRMESAFGSVMVRNTGALEGKEVVIVYLNDEYASVSRPKKQMKFFEKINLKPNEAKVVHFEISQYDMSFIAMNNKRIVEPGRFNLYVGDLDVSFYLKADPPVNKLSQASKNNGFSLMPVSVGLLCLFSVCLSRLRNF
jgi:beta-glucosidase